jgi:hypothetical protein
LLSANAAEDIQVMFKIGGSSPVTHRSTAKRLRSLATARFNRSLTKNKHGLTSYMHLVESIIHEIAVLLRETTADIHSHRPG